MSSRPAPRPKRTPRKRCLRDGCGRTAPRQYGHCTIGCAVIDEEFTRLQRSIEAAGPGSLGSNAWAELVEVADAWSHYLNTRGQLNAVIVGNRGAVKHGPTTL